MVVLHVGVVGVVVVVAYPPQELGFVGDVGDRGQEPARADGPLPDVVTSGPLREQARVGSEILKEKKSAWDGKLKHEKRLLVCCNAS